MEIHKFWLMFFRYALQQMPTLFVFAKKTAEEKEPHIEK